MKDSFRFNNFLPSQELVNRYRQYISGESVNGYFDIEELELLIEFFYNNATEILRIVELGLRLHPFNNDLLLPSINTLIFNEDYNNALGLIERYSDQENYDILLRKTEILAHLKRIEEAKSVAHHLLQQSLEDPDETYIEIVCIFRDCDQYKIALYFIQQREQLSPLSIDLLFEKAFCLQIIQEYEQAIQAYQAIIAMNAYEDKAWFALGLLYFETQRYDEAQHAFTMNVTIDEKDHSGWMHKGHVHFISKEIDKALECYTRCLDLSQDKWEIYMHIAECLYVKKEYSKAVLVYEKSLKERSDNYKAFVGIGLCEMEQGNYAAAERNLRLASKMSPKSYEVWLHLGNLESLQRNIWGAIDHYRKAHSLNNTDVVVNLTLAKALVCYNNYNDAMPYLRVALQSATDTLFIEVLVFLSTCYYYTDNQEEAVYYIKKAIKEDPGALDLFYSICPDALETLSSIIENKNQQNN